MTKVFEMWNGDLPHMLCGSVVGTAMYYVAGIDGMKLASLVTVEKGAHLLPQDLRPITKRHGPCICPMCFGLLNCQSPGRAWRMTKEPQFDP